MRKERFVIRLNAAPGVEWNPIDSEFKTSLKRSYNFSDKEMREDFAARLKALRESAGLTQKQLADRAGIHEGLITRYETAGAFPRDTTMQKLATALNVPLEAFHPEAIKLLDFSLLTQHGIDIKREKRGITLCIPGCPDITVEDLTEIAELFDRCEEYTEKAFQKVKEKYFVNLFIRLACIEYNTVKKPVDSTPPPDETPPGSDNKE